jgi:hypothetical protein
VKKPSFQRITTAEKLGFTTAAITTATSELCRNIVAVDPGPVEAGDAAPATPTT